jgi:uncharacterized protein YndB with AHSA1/START domain
MPRKAAVPRSTVRSGDANIGDDAVRKASGKGWQEWFRILDRFDARAKGHHAAACHLEEAHEVPGWWAQMITVQYERERGLRAVNQRMSGDYEVSVSRTIAAPRDRAWEAFAAARHLNRWFTHRATQRFEEGGTYRNGDGDHGEFRRIVPGKRIRFTWNSRHHRPGSLVEVRFDDKPRGKCSVTVQHMKLASAGEVEDLRGAWSGALDSLRSYLETGKAPGAEPGPKRSAPRAVKPKQKG